MRETSQVGRFTKAVVPSIAEQLANPADLAAEVQYLKTLRASETLTCLNMLITQRMALAMLSLNMGNRRPSKAWVERLKRILTEGRWESTNPEPIAFDTNGILRNGQHRLAAIAETGIAVEVQVAFGMKPSAFSTLDVGLKRTGAQFLDLDGVKNANHVQAFVRLRHRLGTNGEKLDDQGVYLAGRELAKGELLQRAIAAGYQLQHMATVSAAAFAFWKIATASPQRERLSKFWDQLVEGYELERGDPILEVRRLLARTKEASKKLHQMTQQTLQVVWIIWAWNQWIANKTGEKPPRWTKAHSIPLVLGEHS